MLNLSKIISFNHFLIQEFVAFDVEYSENVKKIVTMHKIALILVC